jgi:hypothetical protein
LSHSRSTEYEAFGERNLIVLDLKRLEVSETLSLGDQYLITKIQVSASDLQHFVSPNWRQTGPHSCAEDIRQVCLNPECFLLGKLQGPSKETDDTAITMKVVTGMSSQAEGFCGGNVEIPGTITSQPAN